MFTFVFFWWGILPQKTIKMTNVYELKFQFGNLYLPKKQDLWFVLCENDDFLFKEKLRIEKSYKKKSSFWPRSDGKIVLKETLKEF